MHVGTHTHAVYISKLLTEEKTGTGKTQCLQGFGGRNRIILDKEMP